MFQSMQEGLEVYKKELRAFARRQEEFSSYLRGDTGVPDPVQRVYYGHFSLICAMQRALGLTDEEIRRINDEEKISFL